MREDGGCSWMLNPGNKTGNGGEITEEESLRVDCFASSWAFHQVVSSLSETEEQTHLILAVECILPQQCIAGFFTYLGRSNCFVLSSQPAASSSSFLHKGAPPLNQFKNKQRSSLCDESVRVLVFSSTTSCSNIEHAYINLVKRPFNGW